MIVTGRGSCHRKSMSMQREVLLQVKWRLEIKVLLRNSKTNKLPPNHDPSPCEVLERKGGDVTVSSSAGAEIKRNV